MIKYLYKIEGALMKEDIKKFYEQYELLIDNLRDDYEEYTNKELDEESFFDYELNEEFFQHEYEKYFSFMDKYLDDPKFIEELHLEESDKCEYIFSFTSILFPIEFCKNFFFILI